MKFKSTKDFVWNGRKIYKNITVVESDKDLTSNVWYRVDSGRPEEKPEEETVVPRPRITRIKK